MAAWVVQSCQPLRKSTDGNAPFLDSKSELCALNPILTLDAADCAVFPLDLGFIDPFLFTVVQSHLGRLTYVMIICRYRGPGRKELSLGRYSIDFVEDGSQFCLRIMPTVHMSIRELQLLRRIDG